MYPPSDGLHSTLRVDSIPQTSCGFHTRLCFDFKESFKLQRYKRERHLYVALFILLCSLIQEFLLHPVLDNNKIVDKNRKKKHCKLIFLMISYKKVIKAVAL